MVFPDYLSVENAEIRARMEQFWGTKLDPKRGLTVVEIVNAIHADQIKAMYIMGENPAMSDPDQHHARSALAKLEHLVVQDIFMTETAWHADVILPASAHAEKTGSYTNTNRQIQIGRAAIKMPGEARQDLDLIQELARRIGLPWRYNNPGEVFTEMAQVMPSLKNITWERLEREDSVTYPCDDPGKPGNEIIFANGFPTASGRAKLVPTDLVPPDELPDADYPMVLSTGRMLEHWHTGAMTRRATVLDEIEPQAVALLNGRDLRRMGLRPGAMVRVSTRRGTSASPRRRPISSPTRSSTPSARSPSSSSAPPRWSRPRRKRRRRSSIFPLPRFGAGEGADAAQRQRPGEGFTNSVLGIPSPFPIASRWVPFPLPLQSAGEGLKLRPARSRRRSPA
jgi:formate dehydrogenase major subunit